MTTLENSSVQPKDIEALFSTESEARSAVTAMCKNVGVSWNNVEIKSSENTAENVSRHPAVKHSQKQRVKKSLIQKHITFGLTGLVAGFCLASIAIFTGVQAAMASPLYALACLSFVGLMVGLIIGGFTAVKAPNETPIHSAKAPTDATLVHIHPSSRVEQEEIASMLKGRAISVRYAA